MNKMLVAIFDNEMAADAGQQALRKLHADGDITLYATGVMVKDMQGVVSVRKSIDQAPIGTATGLAVGSLIGLLGGPVGVAVGAMAGVTAGAVRDFWVAGVGLDFIDEAEKHLQPGTVALVAEIEEAQFNHDIAAIKSEIDELESEASHAGDAARTKLQAKLVSTKISLEAALHRARQRVEMLKQEADAKAESLQLQLAQANGEVKARLEDRVKRVKHAYHARGAKLSQAWSLTKEALAG
jgi:uncharacterized membrane protein